MYGSTGNPFCTFYSLYLFCSPRFCSFSLRLLDFSYPSYPFYPLCSSPLIPSVLSILSAHPSFILSVFSLSVFLLYPPYLHISSRSDPPRSSHFAFSPALTPSFSFIGIRPKKAGGLLSNHLFGQNSNKNSSKMSNAPSSEAGSKTYAKKAS